MATVASPYGLRPVNIQGAQPNSGGVRLMAIASAYNTNMFNGDLVQLTAGFITKTTGTTTALPIGVFLGCQYEDPAFGLVNRQYWPANTVPKTGTTAWAYVCDDPDALFEIQAAGAITQASLGLNGDLVQNAGSTATGNSAVAMAATAPSSAATRPLRIVDFVRRPGSTIGDAFTDLVVRINTHANRTP